MKRGQALVAGEEQRLLQEIRKARDWDEVVVKAVKELRQTGAKNILGEEWTEEQGLVLFRGKVYVPQSEELRRKIVQIHHDSTAAGHPGRWKTLELVTRNYWWPRVGQFVAQYTAVCEVCNRTKTFPMKPRGLLLPNSIPRRRWGIVTADLIVELPDDQGYDAILVVVD